MTAKLNKYTGNSFRTESEQELHGDLIIEAIQFKGHEIKYLPRSGDIDYLFDEKANSEFNASYGIEMYINADGFGTNRDIMSKFGFQIPDTAEFSVSKKRFKEEITANEPQILTPREGDLVLFTLTNSLFEIKFVEDEDPFFQLGKQHVFKLTTEIYTYSHEDFDTGDSLVDDLTNPLEQQNDTVNVDRADNEELETDANDVVDDSETNPFA